MLWMNWRCLRIISVPTCSILAYTHKTKATLWYVFAFSNSNGEASSKTQSDVESITMALLHSNALQPSSIKLTLHLSRSCGVIISSLQGAGGMYHDENDQI